MELYCFTITTFRCCCCTSLHYFRIFGTVKSASKFALEYTTSRKIFSGDHPKPSEAIFFNEITIAPELFRTYTKKKYKTIFTFGNLYDTKEVRVFEYLNSHNVDVAYWSKYSKVNAKMVCPQNSYGFERRNSRPYCPVTNHSTAID